MGIKAIIVDTAGTTTDFQFIKEVLFSYSENAMADFIANSKNDFAIQTLLDDVKQLAGNPDLDDAALAQLLVDWIRDDSKATPVKTLQGLVWKQGYLKGDFKGHVYEDAAKVLTQWNALGKRLYSFSSSSADAQELLFKYSSQGDLSGLFYGHFDTSVGQKTTVQAYKNILNTVSLRPSQVLYLSDDLAELNAAREAGLVTCQLVRSDQVRQGSHDSAPTFAQVRT
ncbi:acireductone synthase [Ferrimonas marina]|uniref:Enolase-phosphatase E1 n=1 Tax=Ferrimonas marina TaxID=299255 RepID=A0A1M5XNE2_9GAMM|nr:acireductone synthase [Ferrimonas marina]SHI01259.1 enolase-phosphatase E1 [Ferrimonas marina]